MSRSAVFALRYALLCFSLSVTGSVFAVLPFARRCPIWIWLLQASFLTSTRCLQSSTLLRVHVPPFIVLDRFDDQFRLRKVFSEYLSDYKSTVLCCVRILIRRFIAAKVSATSFRAKLVASPIATLQAFHGCKTVSFRAYLLCKTKYLQ